MTDPRIQAAIASDPQGRLKDPNVLKEDFPPLVRFVEEAIVDQHQTNLTGEVTFKDAIKVRVRSVGDLKTEVPYIAETIEWIPSYEEVVVEKQRPVTVIREKVNEDGVIEEEKTQKYETTEVVETRATYESVKVYPWLDVLKDRLRNGKITQNYYDSCFNAFEAFKDGREIPEDGYPVVEWKMVTPAQAANLINLGIKTVERVAEMTEDAMAAYGLGGQALKKKAAEWLVAGKDQNMSAAKIINQQAQIDELRKELSRFEEKQLELREKAASEEGGESVDEDINESIDDNQKSNA